MENPSYFKDKLQEEFSRRSEKNKRFSLRAFARSMDIDAGSLSKILSGTKVPSWQVAELMTQKLKLPELETKLFLSSVAEAQKLRNEKRLSPEVLTYKQDYPEPEETLAPETFAIISDWYHYAILDMTFVKGFRFDPIWIATELRISVDEAQAAVARLLAMGLLKLEDGKLVKTTKRLSVGNRSSTTPALKERQRQVLVKALESLERDSLEFRDMSSICMAIDPQRIPEARVMIQDFKRRICLFLEGGEQTHMYEFSLALFPTQKIGPEHEL